MADYFDLPINTRIERIIPKNSFDQYTNSKQKELFVKYISRIIWSNNLSVDTTNLLSKDIQEIQIFTVELKQKKEIQNVLDIIDKSIPYHIIFVVEFEDLIYLSTSYKHLSPQNEIKSVIDWTFKSPWINSDLNQYKIELKKNLDNVYFDFCQQLSLKPNKNIKDISDLISHNFEVYALLKEIEQLKRKILNCPQFNKKVELNLELKRKEDLLNEK